MPEIAGSVPTVQGAQEPSRRRYVRHRRQRDEDRSVRPRTPDISGSLSTGCDRRLRFERHNDVRVCNGSDFASPARSLDTSTATLADPADSVQHGLLGFCADVGLMAMRRSWRTSWRGRSAPSTPGCRERTGNWHGTTSGAATESHASRGERPRQLGSSRLKRPACQLTAERVLATMPPSGSFGRGNSHNRPL